MGAITEAPGRFAKQDRMQKMHDAGEFRNKNKETNIFLLFFVFDEKGRECFANGRAGGEDGKWCGCWVGGGCNTSKAGASQGSE